jgi:DNA-directed RNA polymerase subunit H
LNGESKKFLKLFFVFLISKGDILKMHVLQPKHVKLSSSEAEKVLAEFNISLAQLPKISKSDPALPEGCEKGDVVKVVRVDEIYHRVVI